MSSTPLSNNNPQATSPPIITKRDKIAAVADEIISLDKNVDNTLVEVLEGGSF